MTIKRGVLQRDVIRQVVLLEVFEDKECSMLRSKTLTEHHIANDIKERSNIQTCHSPDVPLRILLQVGIIIEDFIEERYHFDGCQYSEVSLLKNVSEQTCRYREMLVQRFVTIQRFYYRKVSLQKDQDDDMPLQKVSVQKGVNIEEYYYIAKSLYIIFTVEKCHFRAGH